MLNSGVVDKLKNMKVMFVDDDAEIVRDMHRYFSRYCDDFITAKNGIDGVELFKTARPSLIIADITMPKINGIEMVRQIEEIDPEVKVIYITAMEANIKNINTKNKICIKKPFLTEELFGALNEVLL